LTARWLCSVFLRGRAPAAPVGSFGKAVRTDRRSVRADWLCFVFLRGPRRLLEWVRSATACEPIAALFEPIGFFRKYFDGGKQRLCFLWPVATVGSFFRVARQRRGALRFSSSGVRAVARRPLCRFRLVMSRRLGSFGAVMRAYAVATPGMIGLPGFGGSLALFCIPPRPAPAARVGSFGNGVRTNSGYFKLRWVCLVRPRRMGSFGSRTPTCVPAGLLRRRARADYSSTPEVRSGVVSGA
jgi:hypothetical protein